MQVEIYYSPYCEGCSGLRTSARIGRVVWKDVTRHIEDAVRLGIFKPPALVVDGRLVEQGDHTLVRIGDFLTQPED